MIDHRQSIIYNQLHWQGLTAFVEGQDDGRFGQRCEGVRVL